MNDGFIPKHGGFENLHSYKKALIIFRATYWLVKRWVQMGSRTRAQMEQSARSGKQHIVEGSLASATSQRTELHLTNVAKGSQGELLEDYKDFLRLRGLTIWDKNDPRTMAIRALGRDDAAYGTYRTYVESDDPEVVGNVMICLCTQECYLLDQQIRHLEQEFLKEGGIRERMTRARREARGDAPLCPNCGKPMRRRTARRGPRAGNPFWGCSSYPECRGTSPI